MTRAAQLQKLRQVRERKAEQANMALVSAQRNRAHWEVEHKKWAQTFEQVRAIGGSVIDEVLAEVEELGDPFLMYQKVQATLRRQRQAEMHALHRRNHASRELGEASDRVVTTTRNFNEAEGRKTAARSIAEKVTKAEARLAEALEEDQTLDDFAAIQHAEATR